MFKDLAKAIQEFATVWATIENRKLDLLQQQLEVQKNPTKPREAMPHGIWLHCQSYSDQWAREDALQLVHEMYDELGDWEKVGERLSTKV